MPVPCSSRIMPYAAVHASVGRMPRPDPTNPGSGRAALRHERSRKGYVNAQKKDNVPRKGHALRKDYVPGKDNAPRKDRDPGTGRDRRRDIDQKTDSGLRRG